MDDCRPLFSALTQRVRLLHPHTSMSPLVVVFLNLCFLSPVVGVVSCAAKKCRP